MMFGRFAGGAAANDGVVKKWYSGSGWLFHCTSAQSKGIRV